VSQHNQTSAKSFSEESTASHDATVMAARTRAALRGATPAEIQRHVDRLDMGDVWGSMLAADFFWRSRANA
jgi:hypothetical protein